MAYNDMQNHIGMQRPQTSGGDRGVQGVRGGGVLTERLVVRPHNTAVVPKKKNQKCQQGCQNFLSKHLSLVPSFTNYETVVYSPRELHCSLRWALIFHVYK